LANTGAGDFDGAKVEIIFNRDMLLNEADAIANVKNSVGILSTETLVAKHPWTTSTQAELDRIAQENRADVDEYSDAFPKFPKSGDTS
jgi:hypothetical protein